MKMGKVKKERVRNKKTMLNLESKREYQQHQALPRVKQMIK
jgi:hypothetical protein